MCKAKIRRLEIPHFLCYAVGNGRKSFLFEPVIDRRYSMDKEIIDEKNGLEYELSGDY